MSTKFALLGLLNIRKMSAYDLEKFAKESIGYFWNESYSNVHRSLKILEGEKLIKKSIEKGSRNKNVFEITEVGKEALSEWLSNHEHTSIYRDELLLKLFVSKRNDYPAILQDLKKTLSERLMQSQVYSELRELVATKQDNLSYKLVLDYGIAENKTTIEWLEKTIKRMEEEL